MGNVHLQKTRNKGHERKALALIVFAIIIVFGIWALQVRAMFSEESMENYRETIKDSKVSLDETVQYRKELEAELPLTDQSLKDAVDEVKASLGALQPENPALDLVAQEMLKELNAQTNAIDSPEVEKDIELVEPETLIEENLQTSTH